MYRCVYICVPVPCVYVDVHLRAFVVDAVHVHKRTHTPLHLCMHCYETLNGFISLMSLCDRIGIAGGWRGLLAPAGGC